MYECTWLGECMCGCKCVNMWCVWCLLVSCDMFMVYVTVIRGICVVSSLSSVCSGRCV